MNRFSVVFVLLLVPMGCPADGVAGEVVLPTGRPGEQVLPGGLPIRIVQWDPRVRFRIEESGVVVILDSQTGREFRLDAAKFEVVLGPEGSGVQPSGDTLTWRESGRDLVEIRRVPPPASDLAPAGLLRWLEGSAAEITAIAFCATGQTAVASSREGSVRLWDVTSGRELSHFDLGPDSAIGACLSPDGRQVAAVGGNGSAAVWEAATGREIRRFSLGRPCRSVAFAGHGNRFWLASAGEGAVVDLWDVAAGARVRSFEQPIAAVATLQMSADGQRILATGGNGGGRQWIPALCRVWDAQSGQVLMQLSPPTGRGHHVALSHDGRHVLQEDSYESDRIDLVEVDWSRLIHTFVWPGPGIRLAAFSPDGRHALAVTTEDVPYLLDTKSGRLRSGFGGAIGRITATAFSPDGARLLLARNNRLELWRTPRFPSAPAGPGREVRRFLHEEQVYAAAFSPDGRRALTGSLDRTLRLWDVASGKELQRLQGKDPKDVVNDLAWSPDGKLAILGATVFLGHRLTLWDVQAWQEVRPFFGVDSTVTSVGFSADGRRAISGALGGAVSQWDVSTKLSKGRFEAGPPVRSVAFSPDGRFSIAAAGLGKGAVYVWDREADREVCRLPHPNVQQAVFAPDDNNRIVSAGLDRRIRLWDLARRNAIGTIASPEPVTAMAISRDGRRLVTGGDNGMVRLWDVAAAAQIEAFPGHGDWVTRVDISRDGRHALSASYDYTARLWALPPPSVGAPALPAPGPPAAGTPRPAAAAPARVEWPRTEIGLARTFESPEDRLQGTAFDLDLSPDGERVVSAHWDARVRLWELATGKLLRRFDAHYHLNPQASGVGKVNAVRFSPDGRHVASGGTDRKVLVWEPDTGKVVRELGQETFVETLAFLPKSDRLLVGGGSGKIGLWNAATGQLDRTYDTEMTGVHGLAVTADGRRALAVGFLREPNGKIHTVLCVWELESGKEVLQKRLPSRSDNRQAAMSADGRFVLADDPVDPYSVVMWEVDGGKKVRSFLQRDGTVFSVAISPEGRRLLVGGGGAMELFEMDSGRHVASFTGHGGPFRAITFSPDGQFAISANNARVFLWRLP